MIKKILLSAKLIICISLSFGQVGKTRNLGNVKDFAKSIHDVSVASNNTRSASSTYMIPTPAEGSITGTVNLKKTWDGKLTIIGNAGKTVPLT